MTTRHTQQEKIDVTNKISEILIHLIDEREWDAREIAGLLNVNENTLSKLKSRSQLGSGRMLITLAILLELQKLKESEILKERIEARKKGGIPIHKPAPDEQKPEKELAKEHIQEMLAVWRPRQKK